MVNRNLIREFDVSEDDWNAAIGVEDGMELPPEEFDWLAGEDVSINQIVDGKIVRVDNEFVIVDVGYKSEGMVARSEWEYGEDGEPLAPEAIETPEVGGTVRVLVEEVEDVAGRHDDRGMLVLSKTKAAKIEKWIGVMENVHEGDTVTGTVTRKIKGGLLVDIGVNVFLPASQVDIRRPHDIGEYIDKEIQCMVLKIDEARRNIVVSRRSLIEQERAKKKAELLKELEVGQIRAGRSEEHRRLRRLCRPRRDRRPPAHHRHELGPDQPSFGDGQDQRQHRGDGSPHRLRPRRRSPSA